jgi:hypothetical protein
MMLSLRLTYAPFLISLSFSFYFAKKKFVKQYFIALFVFAENDTLVHFVLQAAACVPELDVNAILIEAVQCCCLVLVLPWYFVSSNTFNKQALISINFSVFSSIFFGLLR